MAVIHKFLGEAEDKSGLRWDGVPVKDYGSQAPKVKDATRQILLGHDEKSDNFHLRYFEVKPDGYTTLDKHPHEHGVVIIKGRARVTIDDTEFELGYGDVLYVPGDEVHQFFCVGDEPMGFLCIVPAKR